jgi:hypothetical protein
MDRHEEVTDDESFIAIPGLGHADTAVVQGLLQSAGFFFHVHHGFCDHPAVILIRASDKAAIKEFLAEYTVRRPRDEKIASRGRRTIACE